MARWQRESSFPSRSLVRAPTSPSVTSTSSDDRDEVPMVRHHLPPRRPYSRHHQQPHNSHSHHSHHHHGGHSGGHSGGRSHHHHHHHNHQPPSVEGYSLSHLQGPSPSSYRPGTGTLRSTRSVPALALATWDGEPCPVHGHHGNVPPVYPPSGPPTMRRYGSLYDMRPMLQHYPAPPSMHLERKSIHGSMQMLNAGMLQAAYPLPTAHYPPPPMGSTMGPPHGPPHGPPMGPLQTLMRPRPIVFPAGAEPLPIRDPFKGRTPTPGMLHGPGSKLDDDQYSMDHVCCRGHLIVLWIILGVVTAGVILGIILGVTIA